MTEDNFDLAIVDADSILYQIAHYQPSPALCKKDFDNRLKEIMEMTSALDGTVFIKGADNFRHIMADDYKGNRKDNMEPEVKDRLVMLYEYAKEFCIESDNSEADDYCGVALQLAQQEGKTAIVCHIDKDLDMLPGWHYNFRKKEFYHVTPEEGYKFLMKQILMGDATDNIKGIKGVGPKSADKFLEDVPHSGMLNKVLETYRIKLGSDWQKEFIKTANLIYIRQSADDFRELTYEELQERFTWRNNGNQETTNPVDVPESAVH